MIAVVLPTRGLVFTEVENALEQVRFFCGKNVVFLRSVDLPIPRGHNELVEKALMLNDLTHILFIEEDTVMPIDGFFEMVKANVDIAFIDYAINGWACAAKTEDGEILWCGLGCTLVKVDVFKKLEKPYFRVDKSLILNDQDYFEWKDLPNKYGGHDIWFFSQAREAGFKITQVPGECKHMKIDELGKPGVNNGFHQLSQKPVIKDQATYKRPLTTNNELDNNVFIGINPQP